MILKLFFAVAVLIKLAVFCLGEKQGMLINDKCSFWYSRVGDFLWSVWVGGRKSYTAMDRYTRSVRPTPLESARSMALSAMAVEGERFVYLFIY